MSFIFKALFALFFLFALYLFRFWHFSIKSYQLLNLLIFFLFLKPKLVTVKCKCSIELKCIFSLFASWTIRNILNSKMFFLKRKVIDICGVSHLIFSTLFGKSSWRDLVDLSKSLLCKLLLDILRWKLSCFPINWFINTLLIYFLDEIIHSLRILNLTFAEKSTFI